MGISRLWVAIFWAHAAFGVGQINITGFTPEEKAVIDKSVEWTWNTALTTRVEECVFKKERKELLSELIPKLYYPPPVEGELFKGQLTVLRKLALAKKFPDLNIVAYKTDDDTWGWGTLDSVRLYANGRSTGAFQLSLNQQHLSKDVPAANWGGVIAHEMLHNLSHMHPDPDSVGVPEAYDAKYLINAFHDCVVSDGERIVNVQPLLEGITCSFKDEHPHS